MFFRRNAPRLPPLPETLTAGPIPAKPVSVHDGGPGSALEDLSILDPGFQLESFLKEATRVFTEVKTAIWRGDAHALAQHLDEPALGKMMFQAKRLSSQNQEYLVDGFNVLEVKVINYPDNVPGIELGVLFHFKTENERVIDKQRGVTISQPGGSHHREVWVFLRDVEATNKGGSDLERTCPHCSAPLTLLNGLCKYCKFAVRVEEGAWQVIKISVTA